MEKMQMNMAMRCWNIWVHVESKPKVRTTHLIQLQHIANARRRTRSPNCDSGIGIKCESQLGSRFCSPIYPLQHDLATLNLSIASLAVPEPVAFAMYAV